MALSSKNNTIDIKLGHHILLSQSTQLRYRNIEFLCSPINLLEDTVSFVSWVDYKGTLHNSNNMSVLINFSDDPNILPIFGLIKSVFILNNDNTPFLVCNVFDDNYFDKHFHAYNVKLTEKLLCCPVKSLHCIQHTTHCVLSNGLWFILK